MRVDSSQFGETAPPIVNGSRCDTEWTVVSQRVRQRQAQQLEAQAQAQAQRRGNKISTGDNSNKSESIDINNISGLLPTSFYQTQHSSTPSSSKRNRRRRQKKRQHSIPSLPTCQDVHHLKSLLRKTEWWYGTHQLLTSVLDRDANQGVAFLQCLGLGSFEKSQSSLHQLACALLLKDVLHPSYCTIADPIMTDVDNQLAKDLSITVLEAQSDVNQVTIHQHHHQHKDNDVDEENVSAMTGVLFMPHCGRDLNMAILSRWIERKRIDDLIYVGNLLSPYFEGLKNKQFTDEHRIRQLFKSEYLQEAPCPDSKSATFEFAFNDLAVVCFTCKSMDDVATQ